MKSKAELDKIAIQGTRTISSSRMRSKEELDAIAKKRTYERKLSNLETVASDLDSRLNKLKSDTNGYISSYQDRYKDGNSSYRSDSADWLSKMKSAKSAYDSESAAISTILSDYEEFLNPEYVSNVRSFLDDGSITMSDLADSAKTDSDYWSRWEDEDAYNTALQLWNEREKMKTYDTDAGKLVIDNLSKDYERAAELQKDLDGLKKIRDFKTLITPSAITEPVKKVDNQIAEVEEQLNKILGGYESFEELEKALSEKKDYYDKAKLLQDSISLPEEAQSSSDYEEYSSYIDDRNFLEKGWYYWSDGGFSTVDNLYHTINLGEPYEAGKTFLDENTATYMTSDERETFNYYYNKNEKDKAQAYYDSLEETLEYRRAGNIVDTIGDNKAMELVFGAYSGVLNHYEGVNSFIDGVLEDGVASDDDYRVPTAESIASSQIREGLHNDGLGWGVAYDVVNNTAQQVPMILMGALNPTAGIATMGASASGNAYEEARREGYTYEQARNYSMLVGASEATLEKLLGGLSKLGLGGEVTEMLSKTLTSKIKRAFGKAAVDLGISMADEFTEEYLQEILDPVFKNLTLDTEEDIKFFSTDALYSGVLGALSAGLFEGVGGSASKAIQRNQQGQQIIDDGGAEQLRALAYEMYGLDANGNVIEAKADDGGDSTAQNRQVISGREGQNLKRLADKVGRKTNARNVSKLSAAIDTATQNYGISEVRAALKSKGFSDNLADYGADVIAKAYFDTATTQREQERALAEVQKDQKLLQTVKEIIADEDSDFSKVLDRFEASKLGIDTATFRERLNEASAEIKSKISETGVAELIDSGEAVTIDKTTPVARVETQDGERVVYLNTDKGEVKTTDIAYASGDQALLFELTSELSSKYANEIISRYDGKSDVGTYVNGMKEGIFLYGALGITESEASPNSYFMSLSEADRAYALKLGSRYGIDSVEEAEANVRKAIKERSDIGEDTIKNSFHGYAEDGKGMYQSNFPMGTPKRAKGERVLEYIKNVWSKNPISLKVTENGKTEYIEAQFDPTYDEDENIRTDASKLAGGNRHGTASDQRVTLDLADDYYQIASEAKYNYSKSEVGKSTEPHAGVLKWHYFVNDIYFSEYGSNEYTPYRVTINVKEKENGNYVYSFSAEKQKSDTPQTLHAVVNDTSKGTANVELSNTIIPKNGDSVNTESKEKRGKNKKGVVHFYKGVLRNIDDMSETQRAIVLLAKQLASITGIDIHFYDSTVQTNMKGKRGFFRSGDNSIHLDLNESITSGRFAAFTLSHEFTHFIRKWSAAKFKVFADFLVEQYGKHEDLSMEAAVRSMMKRRGMSDYDAAFEEVVANYCERMLLDSKAMEKLAALREKDSSLFEKLRAHIRELVQRLRDILAGRNIDHTSPEGLAFLEMKDSAEQFYALFEDAAVTAVENYQAANGQNVERTTDEIKYSVNEKFSKEIDEWYRSDKQVEETFILGSTGEVLQGLGAIENDIYMYSSKINLILREHPEMTLEEIKKIPQILDNPVMVLKSKHDNNRLVLYSTIKAQNGKPILVIMDLKPVENGFAITDMQKSVSSYTKTATNQKTAEENGMNFIRTSEVLYVEKNKATKLLRSIGFYMPIELQQSGFIGSISYKGRSVNIAGEEFSKVFIENSVPAQSKSNGNSNSLESDGISDRELLTQRIEKEITDEVIGDYKKEEAFEKYKRLDRQLIELERKLRKLRDERSLFRQGNKQKLFAEAESKDIIDQLNKDIAVTAQRINSIQNEIRSLQLPKTFEKYIEYKNITEEIEKIRGDIRKRQNELRIATENSDRSELFNRAELEEEINILEKRIDELKEARSKLSPDVLLNTKWRYKTYIDMIAKYESELGDIEKEMRDIERSNSNRPKIKNEIGEIFDEAERQSNQERWNKLYDERKELRKRITSVENILVKTEKTKWIVEMLENERAEMQRRIKREGSRAIREYKSSVKKNELQIKTKRIANELSRRLVRGTKQKHIPESLQPAVADVLICIDTSLSDRQRFEAMYQNKIDAEADPELKEKLIKDRNNLLDKKFDRYRSEVIAKFGLDSLNRLRSGFVALRAAEDKDTRLMYDEEVENMLASTIEAIGDTPLDQLSYDQSEKVYNLFAAIRQRIYTANKAFADEQAEKISSYVNEADSEFKLAGKDREWVGAVRKTMRKFGWNNLKPIYAIRMLGSKTFERLYNNLRKGEDRWATDVYEAREFFESISKKYHYNNWDTESRYEFKSTTGMKFSLTLEQIMSIYAYSRRKQALPHLEIGGIVFEKDSIIVKKHGIPVGRKFAEGVTAYNISRDQIREIISKLTDDQRGYVDEMQRYLSEVMGEKGNEVSMKMYGFRLFTEKYYFPIMTSKTYNVREKGRMDNAVKLLRSSGISQETKPDASNPVVIRGFTDVWAEHVNQMSMYHGLVLPLEDFMRVFNYGKNAKSETETSSSLEETIKRYFGTEAFDYIKKLLQDINGEVRSDPTEGLTNKLISLSKRNAIAGSMSVVAQQPSSLGRAFAYISHTYFKPTKDGMNHTELWSEVKKYAPVAIIKEMGGFDTGRGMGTIDYIKHGVKKKGAEKIKEGIDAFTDFLPSKADELTWCAIWNAVKRETKHNYPNLSKDSEAFLTKCGERFTEIITLTQVYDSTFSRSGYMRSNSSFQKMATAFMAEPTVTANMMFDAILMRRRGIKGKSGRVVASVVTSIVFNSILKSIVYAWRDDDEDKEYIEKYLENLVGSIVDDMNPLNYIPYVKDAMSILMGYDVERLDMRFVTEVVNAFKTLKNENASTPDKIEKGLFLIPYIGPLLKNIFRDGYGLVTNVFIDFGKNALEGNPFGNITGAGIWNAMKDELPFAEFFGITEDSNPEQLLNALTSGDEVHAARVLARYESEAEAQSALQIYIGEQFREGKISRFDAQKYLTKYCFDREKYEEKAEKERKEDKKTARTADELMRYDAYWMLDKWEYQAETADDEDAEGWQKYDDFYTAVETGADLKNTVQRYLDNGVTKEALARQITTHFKPLYIKMSKSEQQKFLGYLTNAYYALGYEKEDRYDKIREIQREWKE